MPAGVSVSVEGVGRVRRHSTRASSSGQQKRLDLALLVVVTESEWSSSLRNSVPSASPTCPMSISCNSAESANRFFASSPQNDLESDEDLDLDTVTETPI